MRTFRRFYLALILILGTSVFLSATGHIGKAPYKPCLSRLTQQLKLAGFPQPGRNDVAASLPARTPLSAHDALLLLGFPGFNLRHVADSPITRREFLARTRNARLDISPQQSPFSLRV